MSDKSMGLNVGAVVAGATCRQLERLNGEGEILVIGVVDQESVVERFLWERKESDSARTTFGISPNAFEGIESCLCATWTQLVS